MPVNCLERYNHYNNQSRGFETSRDLVVRRLTAQWIEALNPCVGVAWHATSSHRTEIWKLYNIKMNTENKSHVISLLSTEAPTNLFIISMTYPGLKYAYFVFKSRPGSYPVKWTVRLQYQHLAHKLASMVRSCHTVYIRTAVYCVRTRIARWVPNMNFSNSSRPRDAYIRHKNSHDLQLYWLTVNYSS